GAGRMAASPTRIGRVRRGGRERPTQILSLAYNEVIPRGPRICWGYPENRMRIIHIIRLPGARAGWMLPASLRAHAGTRLAVGAPGRASACAARLRWA